MGELVLKTDRLELRQIGADDLDAHLQHLNSPAVMEQLGGPRTREELAEKHATARKSFAEEGFGFMLAFEKQTGELVAHCGLKRVSYPQAPNHGDHEIGWLVRADRWRMGYATETVHAILDWAFGPIEAPHVVALTSQGNVASWKLMEKLGMERRQDLDFDDPDGPPENSPLIQYSLTKKQWETRT